MICQDCQNNVHEQVLGKDDKCDCICHPGVDVVDGVPTSIETKVNLSTLPNITRKDVSSTIKYLEQFSATHIHKEGEEGEFCNFLHKIHNASMESTRFQQFLYRCKQMLHTHNRTTGLMQIYATGVIVGIYLTHPELFPEFPQFSAKDESNTIQ